ncbi:hypothetical protein ABN77_25585 [Salmonella enterica subsp. salamae]|nr:hypothetical protein [Salmonella enterica]ECH9564861.1 hypothetical protein [Salmonella enterica subsp. salamae]ECI4610726.1 hypothetical protein [Salmonella enterica subsp. diarizonae]
MFVIFTVSGFLVGCKTHYYQSHKKNMGIKIYKEMYIDSPEKLPLYAKRFVVWLVVLPVILNRAEHSGVSLSRRSV